jgi:hypothetical protein
VGDGGSLSGGSLGAFYRSEGGLERGWEGMHPTALMDLQCINFRVGGELGVETVEGAGDMACILEEKRRGRNSAEGW